MSEDRPLTGQRALVTGANSGIGEAIACALAAAGAQVVINYVVNQEAADQVVARIKDAGGDAMAIQADISKEAEVLAMFKSMKKTFGGIDILVNNAGLQQDAAFVDMTLEQWQKVMDVNLTGHFLCAREAAREFIRCGINLERSKAAGKIIFISSVHEVIPWAGHVNYAVSKGGLGMLMRSVSQELAAHRIRVNSVAPGAIRTPINQDVWSKPESKASLLGLIPYGRIGAVEDVAKAVVWLSSDASDYIVGETLFIDGGMTLYPGFAEGDG